MLDIAAMSNSSSAGTMVAGRPGGSVDAVNTALFIYEPSAAELIASDSLAEAVRASEAIRNNTNNLIDMVHDGFRNSGLYTEEETEDMLGLIRDQLTELYSMSEEVTLHTKSFLCEACKRYGADMQRLSLQHIEREQHLTQTINIQHGTIQTLQQNLSRLTLHTGLVRDENQGLSNENLVLRQRLEQLEASKNLLQNLSKDMSVSLVKHQKELQCMNIQHQDEVARLTKELENEKSTYMQAKDYEKLLVVALKDMEEIKKRNDEIKAKAEATVNAAAENIDKKRALLEDAEKHRAKCQLLQKKGAEAQQEYLVNLQAANEREEDAKSKEKAAIKRYETANAKFENLQALVKAQNAKAQEKEMANIKKHEDTVKELEHTKKAYGVLLDEFNKVKELSEYFALQATEANKRELEALDSMQRMNASIKREERPPRGIAEGDVHMTPA